MGNVKMTIIAFSLFVEICGYLAIFGSLVVGEQITDITANKYSCLYFCSMESPDAFPLILETRSIIECAAACSRREWCSKYNLRKSKESNVFEPQPLLYECTMFAYDGSTCSPIVSSQSETVVCLKAISASVTSSDQCQITNKSVLEGNNVTATSMIDYSYLQTLLSFGNDLQVQYVNGNSRHITMATFVTIYKSGITCGTILDSAGGSNNSSLLHFAREFCIDSSLNIREHNVSITPFITTNITFLWNIHRRGEIYIANNKVVFTKGSNSTLLEVAVENGFEIKIFSKTSCNVMNADVISQNKGKSDEIAAQTTILQHGQYNIVSYFTTQAPKTFLLDSLLGNGNNPNSDNSDVIWFSDSCWSLVYHTLNSSSEPKTSLNDLKSTINSGRRIRVRFSIDNLTILATPDFVGIDDSGIIHIHVLRVLSQKSFFGELVKSIALLNSNQSQLTHYYVTSNGNISNIDAGKVTSLTDKGDIHWYSESSNYTLVYESSSRSMESMKRLTDEVLAGKGTRVKVYNGTNSFFYSCHMVHVIQDGQEVKCQVNGQLGVQFLGVKSNYETALQSITSHLGTIVGISPTSGCFQTLILYAYQGSIDYAVSCIGPSNSSQVTSERPQNVDWFVAV